MERLCGGLGGWGRWGQATGKGTGLEQQLRWGTAKWAGSGASRGSRLGELGSARHLGGALLNRAMWAL